MSLSSFIHDHHFTHDHHEETSSEFAIFATTSMPPGPEMTEPELHDHAEDIFTESFKT